MTASRKRGHNRRASSMNRHLHTAIAFGALLHGVQSDDLSLARSIVYRDLPSDTRAGAAGQNLSLPEDWKGKVPLVITNKCSSTLWPGIASQAGTGPGIGGFALDSGKSRELWVSADWQGRVWGRTNCTVNGDSCSCKTGDCFGKLNCQYSGATPATLVEFNLAGGLNRSQTFYDISLVDGYNLPMGLNYLAAKNTTFIPPNLTNCACIATAGWLYQAAATGDFYSNSTYPVPLEPDETNQSVRDWCPWPYLAFPPKRPGDGVYPYPDDNVVRPEFSPCNSACAATGSDKDCCVGKYHSSSVCKPSLYSKSAKAICPDAYSYAFDDTTSTFSIPKGGGFEVILCPSGRSTNILSQLSSELDQLASDGMLSSSSLRNLKNVTYVETERSVASDARPWIVGLMAATIISGAWLAV